MKYFIMDNIDRYQLLSLQLFGKSNSVRSYRGPFVDLSSEQVSRTSGNGGTRLSDACEASNSKELKSIGRRKKKIRGPLGFCLICYSSISRKDRLYMLGKGKEEEELCAKIGKRVKDINEFLRILASSVGVLNKEFAGHTSTKAIFEKAVNRLSTTPWCLCLSCNNACDLLLSRYREVNELQAKFISAIRLSQAIRDKDPHRKISVVSNDVDVGDDETCCSTNISLKPQKRTKITLRMKTVNQVRMCLLGGKSGCRKSLAKYVNFNSMIKKEPEPLENITTYLVLDKNIDFSGLKNKDQNLNKPKRSPYCPRRKRNLEGDIISYNTIIKHYTQPSNMPNQVDIASQVTYSVKLEQTDEHDASEDFREVTPTLAVATQIGTDAVSLSSEHEKNHLDDQLDNVSDEILTDGHFNDDGLDSISIPDSTLADDNLLISSLQHGTKSSDPSKTILESDNHLKSAHKQPSKGSRVKGLAHPRSYIHIPPEKLSKNQSAIWHRQMRAQNPHLSCNELKKANLRKTGITQKGQPGLTRRPISELKECKNDTGYVKFRMTHGQHMSLPAYQKMRRIVLSKEQKVVEGSTFPSRANKGAPGLMTCWRKKDGKMFYRDVEIKKNDSGLFICPFCDRMNPTNRKSLTLHMNKHHIDLSDGHSCDHCGKRFYYQYQLSIHIQEKHGGGYQCEICGQKLSNKSTLFFHKRVKHQGIKPHICEHCGKGFATKKDMVIHVRRHTGERPFICHVCAETFIDKQSMKLHIRRKHPDMLEETVDCSQRNIKIKSSGGDVCVGLPGTHDS